VREELEIQRPGMKVIRHYEEVLTLTDPKTQVTRVSAASAPHATLRGCFVGPQLLATLGASHFADHLPYYREADIFARLNVALARSTQCRWMKKLAALVRPQVNRMCQRVRQSHVLGIVETPIPGQTSQPGKGTTTAYLYARDRCIWGQVNSPMLTFRFCFLADEK
jgi:transposase